jgi:hypothetical protein
VTSTDLITNCYCNFNICPIIAKATEALAMDTTEYHESEIRPGDLLVGADNIRAFLVDLGMPEDTDVYYLKRAGRWPIQNTSGKSGKLIASKRRLARHAEEITRGPAAA